MLLQLEEGYNIVMSFLQRQLQWGLTLVVLGIYNRTMLEQQVSRTPALYDSRSGVSGGPHCREH